MAGTRKIAAILVADIVGYSRLAGADEDRTLSRLRGLRSDLIDPAIDYVGLAQSLGVKASRAKTVPEVKAAFTRALADGGPVLIDVAIDNAFKPL